MLGTVRSASLLFALLFTLLLPFTGYSQGTASQTIQFAPVADRPVNTAPFQIIAISSAYLPVTLSVAGPASLNGRFLTLTGVGTVTVTATQPGNAQYAAASATQISFQSQPVTPAINWAAPAAIPYGTPLGAAQLNAAALASPVVSQAADVATVTENIGSSAILPSGAATVYPQSSPVLTYGGTSMVTSTAANDNNGYVGAITDGFSALIYTVSFTCDCQQFEFVLQSRNGVYRLWVDGAYTSPDALTYVNQFPQTGYIRVQFPDKRLRQIRLSIGANAPFFGVNTANGDTILPVQMPIGPQVMIFGDSWTGPTILPPAIPPAQDGLTGSGYPQTLGEYFNWNYWDDGIGGTGFLNPGTDAYGRNFAQRITADVCPYKFKAIVLLGGTNDGSNQYGTTNGEENEQAAVTQALTNLQNCEPGVPVYFFGPQDQDPNVEQAMQAAAAAAPNVAYYLDFGNINQTGWLYGNSLDPTVGNNYLYFNGHPTPLGHDFLAEQIANTLMQKFPELTPQPYTLMQPQPLAGTFTYGQNEGTLLPAGSNSVSVAFHPADAEHFLSTTGTGTVLVTQATSSTTLSSSQSSGAVTLSVKVAPQIAGTPTGTITFLDAGKPFGTAPLSGGAATATFTTANLPAGSHSITASYGGDTNFLGSGTASALPIVNTAPDFSFTITPGSLTVLPGATGSVQLAATPTGGLTGALTAQCSGLPANATCSLSTLQLDASQAQRSATLSIQTYTPTTQVASNTVGRLQNAMAAACLLGLLPVWRKRRTLGRLAAALALLIGGFAGSTLLTGCGSASKIDTAAPGTYTVQVALTGTGGSTQPVTHTQPLTVILP